MADQTEAEKMLQPFTDAIKSFGISQAINQGTTDASGIAFGETYQRPSSSGRVWTSPDAPIRTLNYTVQAPQFSGYIVLNARVIALDAPDKLVKRAIKLPFVPVAGMVLRVTDGYALPIRDDATKHDVVFTFRVIESLWDEQQEQFQVRCEKLDGQGYERLADAVHWESYK